MPSQKPNRPCRIDDELYLKMKFLAKLENRSFNNFVESLFIKTVAAYEAENGEIKVDPDELYQ